MLHPQDNSLATYAKKIKKEEAIINWNNSAEKIHKKIMAFNSWPVAETTLSGERIRIHDSNFEKLEINGFPGNIRSVNEDSIEVFTKNGLLVITKLQKDNSRVMNVKDFIKSTNFLGKKFE
jgi:methionyl-tRNA formyltransferase